MARRISSPILVGRDAESQSFELALDDAVSGRPAVLVLGGEAGVGKSRLVAEFAAATRARGGLAAVGSTPAPAGSERVALAALVQALRALLRSVDARLLDHLLGPARGDLAALLPELGVPTEAMSLDPFRAARLAEAVLVAIESVAARQPPLLFALEDLHWMDDATRATVMYVCRTLIDAPAIVLLTYRSNDPREAGGLLDLLAEIDRIRNVERLELEPLGDADVAVQVRAIVGSDLPDDRLIEIARRSEGNPFLVEELLLAEQTSARGQTPASVRMMVEARLGSLSPGTISLVQATVLAGRPVDIDLLQEVTALPASVLGSSIDEALATHLLVARTDTGRTAGTQLEARHVLTAEAIVGTMSSPRRREWHRAFALALSGRQDAPDVDHFERASWLAQQWTLAGDDARALPALLGEAAAAEAAGVFDAAARAYRMALETWARLDSVPGARSHAAKLPDRTVVLERAALTCGISGQPDVAVEMIREAMSTRPVTRVVDPERRARLTMHLARLQADAGHAGAEKTCRTAVAASASGSVLRARCLVLLARIHSTRGDHRRALVAADDAARIATALDARHELIQARNARAVALVGLGRPADALEALAAAGADSGRMASTLTVPTRPSRLVADLHAFLDRATALERAGRPDEAARAAQDGVDLARRRGLATVQAAVLAAVAARDLLRTGAWDEAARIIDSVDRGGHRLPSEASLVRALLAVRRGEWEAADRAIASADAAGVPPDHGWAAYRALVVAEMAWWRRRYLEGLDGVDASHDLDTTSPEPEMPLSLAMWGLRLWTEARSARTRRRGLDPAAPFETAERQVVRLEASSAGLERAAPTPRALAVVATAAAEQDRWRILKGRHPAGVAAVETAASLWQAAARMWDAAGDPYEAAWCRWRLAEALAETREREAARAVLRAVMGVVDGLAATPLAREVESLARRARLMDVARVAPAAPAAAPSSPTRQARRFGLSGREVEVLALVAEGLSDREVAERLFITTKTAGHHVSHILAKLGLERRGEAAALAFRMGLVERES